MRGDGNINGREISSTIDARASQALLNTHVRKYIFQLRITINNNRNILISIKMLNTTTKQYDVAAPQMPRCVSRLFFVLQPN